MGRIEFGVLDTRRHWIRPAFSRFEKTRPGIIGKDFIQFACPIIQTDILLYVRREMLIEHNGIDSAMHHLTSRIQHIFTIRTFLTYGIVTNNQIRTEETRVGIISVRHTLVGIGPIREMPGFRITRSRCIRVRQEIAFSILFEEGNSHTDTSCVFGLRIKDQGVFAVSVGIGKSEHSAGLILCKTSCGGIR